ncbi:MAG: beta strand repeat-containing protein, partial [Bacteroidia bacterium]
MKQNHSQTCFLLLFACFSCSLLAQNARKAQFDTEDVILRKMYEKGGAFEGFSPENELIQERSFNTKVFDLGNGQRRALVGAGAVHYQEDGQWRTISNELEAEGTVLFRNHHNLFKTTIHSQNGVARLQLFQKGLVLGINPQIDVIFENGKTDASLSIYPALTYNSSHSPASNPRKAKETAGNIVSIEEIFPDINKVWEQKTAGVEYSYVLKNANALSSLPNQAKYLAFSEEITLPDNWTISKEGKGLSIKDESGKEMWVFKPIFCYDDSYKNGKSEQDCTEGENCKSHLVGEYELIPTGNKYIVKLLIPAAWLLSSARQFPITIDPPVFLSINTFPQIATYWTSTTDDGGSEGGTDDQMKVGFRDQTFDNDYWDGQAQFDLTAIPNTATICNVNLHVFQTSHKSPNCTDENKFRIGRLNGNPNMVSSTWATVGAATDLLAAYPPLLDVYGPAAGYVNYNQNTNNVWYVHGCGNQGIIDVAGALGIDRLALGLDCTVTNHDGCAIFCGGCGNDDDDYIIFAGYTSTNRPYLAIDYQVLPVATFGNNLWNVYGYNGANLSFAGSFYRGYYTDNNININTPAVWAANTSPSAATNWFGCAVSNDNHTVRYMRQGFPCGEYRIDIANHDDDMAMYVNGTQINNAAFAGVSGTTISGVWQGILDGTSTIEFRHQDGAGGSNLGVNFVRLDNWSMDAGQDMTVCVGQPITLTGAIVGTPPNCYIGNVASPCSPTLAWSGAAVPSSPNSSNPLNIPSIASIGTYNITLTGTSPTGCVASDIITITVDNPPTVTASNNNPQFCSGGTTNIALTLPVAGSSVDWTRNNTASVTGTTSANGVTGAIQVVLTNTTSSSQMVTFTLTPQSTNCAGTPVTVTVTIDPVPVISASVSPTAVCSDNPVLINAAGNPSFSWTRDNLTNVPATAISPANGVMNGTLTLPLSLGNGITTPQTVNITLNATANNCNAIPVVLPVTVNPRPVATIASSLPSPITICGNGIITLTAGGGSNYEWLNNGISTGITNNPFNPTTSGTYAAVVSDINGCQDTTTLIPVTILPAPTANIAQISPALNATLCLGDSVMLSASGGNSATSSYSWILTTPNYQVNNVAVIQSNGSFCVSVTDANGCQDTACSSTFTFNTLPSVAVSASNNQPSPICADPSVNLVAQAAGGAGNYTYAWWDNGTLVAPATSNTTLSAGTAGAYTVQVSDANGCKNESNTFVINPVPTASIGNVPTTAPCLGTNVTLVANGGLNYTWLLNGNNIATGNTYNPTVSGTYGLIASNAFGCTDNASPVTITFNATPTASLQSTAGNSPLCSDASTLLNVTAANGTPTYTYTWYQDGVAMNLPTTTSSIPANAAGNYTVLVNDANGCEDFSNDFIINPSPTVTVNTLTATPYCQGNSVQLQAVAGGGNTFNYVWSPLTGAAANGNLLDVTQSGTYTVNVTNNFNCTTSATSQAITFNANPAPFITASTGQITLCASSTATLTAGSLQGTGPFAYTWYNNGLALSLPPNTTTIPATNAGNYSVSVTDASGCEGNSAVFVVNPSPTASLTPLTNASACQGNDVQLLIGGQGTYTWSPLTGTSLTGNVLTVTQSGNYQVTVSNGFNCTATSQAVNVTIHPNPTVSLTATNGAASPICANNASLLNVTAFNGTAPYSYSWYQNGLQVNAPSGVPSAGVWTAIAYDNNGCQSATSLPFSILPAPTASLLPDLTNPPAPYCQGINVLQYNVQGGSFVTAYNNNGQNNAFSYNNDALLVNGTGDFCVVLENANGCRDTVCTGAITFNPTITTTISTNATTICEGNSTTLYASPSNNAFTWYQNGNALATNADSLVVTQSGTYVAVANDANGCSIGDTVAIAVQAVTPANITFTGAAAFCINDALTLTATQGGTNYQWSVGGNVVQNGSNNQLVVTNGNYQGNGQVSVVISSGNGCTSTASQTIIMNPLPSATISNIQGNAFFMCSGDDTTLIATPTTGTYSWYHNGLMVSNNPTLPISASGNGTYWSGGYWLTVTSAEGCSATSQVINISQAAEPTAAVATVDDLTLCRNERALLTANSNSNFVWLYNGSPIPTSDNASSWYGNAAGTYTILATNECG